MVLENAAGKPKPGEKDYVDLSQTELDVSFIKIVREKPMKIHTDNNHSAARKHHNDGKELPYTIDLPMSGDGIRIGIYGDDPLDSTEKFDEAIKNDTIKREAVVVTCPPQACHSLASKDHPLWRISRPKGKQCIQNAPPRATIRGSQRLWIQPGHTRVPSKGQRRHPVEYTRLYVEVDTGHRIGRVCVGQTSLREGRRGGFCD